MKLILDCQGGDKSPGANVAGGVLALRQYEDLQLILTGDEAALRAELDNTDWPKDRVEIAHAPDTITGSDKPTDAIRLKRESSMIKAVALLRKDPEIAGLVSTGATGALVAAAMLRLGRIKNVRRAAFCPLLPTMVGGIVGVCDSGASMDCTPEQLQQQAIMGSRYLECVYGVENPRVALLNVGVEEEKGDDLRKAAGPLLKQTPHINFVGNMESRDLLSGKYDLVVCDGFSGNVLVKTTEGTAVELLKKVKRDIYAKTVYKIGGLFLSGLVKQEKAFMNYQNYGGSVLLGTEKTVVKGHGSSDASAVCKCIEQAYRMEAGSMNRKIEDQLAELYQKTED